MATPRRVVVSGRREFVVWVVAASSFGIPGIPQQEDFTYYYFDDRFAIPRVELAPSYKSLDRQLESLDIVTSASRSYGLPDAFPIRRWNGRGFDLIAAPKAMVHCTAF